MQRYSLSFTAICMIKPTGNKTRALDRVIAEAMSSERKRYALREKQCFVDALPHLHENYNVSLV